MVVTVTFKLSRTSGNVSIGRPDVRARVIANPLSGAKEGSRAEGCIDDDRKSKARFWTSSFVLPAPIHTIGKRRRTGGRGAESALYAPPAIDNRGRVG